MELSGPVAPFVITYRRVTKRPKIELVRRFVGVRKLISNVITKIQDLVEDMAFDTEKKVLDPGESQAVHWAINVNEPFDTDGRSELTAVHIPGVSPPAAYRFEVIQILESGDQEVPHAVRSSPPEDVADRIRASMPTSTSPRPRPA